ASIDGGAGFGGTLMAACVLPDGAIVECIGLTAPLAALALFLPGLPVAAAPLPDFPPAGTAQVKTVEADATLELADGRRLRLAGIDLPAHGALARQARDAL